MCFRLKARASGRGQGLRVQGVWVSRCTVPLPLTTPIAEHASTRYCRLVDFSFGPY